MSIVINGETRLVPIIGDPIGQVKSPGNLSAILADRGANTIVVPAHVVAAELAPFLQSVRLLRNLDGIIVTVPHKFAMLDYCDEVTERARFVGAVNVLRRRSDGSWFGDMLDGHGFVEGVLQQGFDVRGHGMLLVGAGGAGSAIAFEALQRGATKLAIHDLDVGRRDRLVDKLARRFPGRVVRGTVDPAGYDLVANATPTGMAPDDPLPVDASRLSPGQFVADVITRPEVSPLVQQARDLGCATMMGIGMFNAQANLIVDFLLEVDSTPSSVALT